MHASGKIASRIYWYPLTWAEFNLIIGHFELYHAASPPLSRSEKLKKGDFVRGAAVSCINVKERMELHFEISLRSKWF